MGLYGVSETLKFEVPQFVRTLRVGFRMAFRMRGFGFSSLGVQG